MKVHLRMLGCRLNQSEIDTMARQLIQQNHEIVDDPTLADSLIVNTCTVTSNAAKDSRKLIRELNRSNPDAEITVTGCYAQISSGDLAALPGVVRVVGNREKDALVEQITGISPEVLEPISRDSLVPGVLGRTRAFVKVQDGCDNTCTFCVTTIARGEGRSQTIADVVDEVRCLHGIGHQEVVLTGVHLGSYGNDLGYGDGLVNLVRAILSDTDVPRLRLSSLEPWDLSPGFFNLWHNPRLCRHLHLPLQSGCDQTLRRMGRKTNQSEYRALVQTAREHIPGLSITTDVMVGFPGETDEEFAASETFIREMDFAKLHVFRYSLRPETPAALMKGHISKAVKRRRSACLLTLSHDLERDFAGRFVGQMLPVLWEQVVGATEDGFINVGYTDNYIRTRCVYPQPLTNSITLAQVEDYTDGHIITKAVIE